MNSLYKQVQTFNRNILGIEPRELGLQDSKEFLLSFQQMSEETFEFLQANQEEDLVGVVDALIDNLVFTLGVVYKLGINEPMFNEMFTTVMAANMEKKIGKKNGRGSIGAADAVKPLGWVPPEVRLNEIINVGKQP